MQAACRDTPRYRMANMFKRLRTYEGEKDLTEAETQAAAEAAMEQDPTEAETQAAAEAAMAVAAPVIKQAQLPGICGACGRRIQPGEELAKLVGFDDWVHSSCTVPEVLPMGALSFTDYAAKAVASKTGEGEGIKGGPVPLNDLLHQAAAGGSSETKAAKASQAAATGGKCEVIPHGIPYWANIEQLEKEGKIGKASAAAAGGSSEAKAAAAPGPTVKTAKMVSICPACNREIWSGQAIIKSEELDGWVHYKCAAASGSSSAKTAGGKDEGIAGCPIMTVGDLRGLHREWMSRHMVSLEAEVKELRNLLAAEREKNFQLMDLMRETAKVFEYWAAA